MVTVKPHSIFNLFGRHARRPIIIYRYLLYVTDIRHIILATLISVFVSFSVRYDFFLPFSLSLKKKQRLYSLQSFLKILLITHI